MNTDKARMAAERLALWFFPRRCVWCAGITQADSMLCENCACKAEQQLQPGVLSGTQLPLVSVFAYHSDARRIMLHVKFRAGRSAAHSIGYAMADALAASRLMDESGWLFCCVPMTQAKRRERGYNQSELLAKAAARWLGMQYMPELLVKLRETQTQHDLPRAQRQSNVAGVFAPARPEAIAGRRIVLCDDICTTGYTLLDAVRALQEAGAAQIICLTYLR